ncbi:hypothetical protein NLJ89_g9143 [Agrocybe chaxingu]|uniref:Uncharacterized protein n=1 Tax=Agrocybe chaxingu TaxID=84603 RepID=A0A9W8MTU1_9AGAR|nr:hypothetical protein NLJ89_g9143 [Agrocybe chaxingu]
MLFPPLSRLPKELRERIVDLCAKLPEWWIVLSNLALADRAFTYRCHVHLFAELALDNDFGPKKKLRKQIEQKWKILSSNPSLAKLVRVIDIKASDPQLFSERNFTKMLELFQVSPVPPHTIRIEKRDEANAQPGRFAAGLEQFSLSQSLTTIHLDSWANVPLDIFLVCSRLKEVTLESIEFDKKQTNTRPNNHPPKIEHLWARNSDQLINRFMQIKSPAFPVVHWSNLLILHVSPHERKTMALVQRILDMTSNTLEQLFLTVLGFSDMPEEKRQFPLSPILNLQAMGSLHVFEIFAVINCKAKKHTVLKDLGTTLDSLPRSNSLEVFSLELEIFGKKPYQGCVDEDWEELCHKVVLVSGGKPLVFNLDSGVYCSPSYEPKGTKELYDTIENRFSSS